MILYENLKPGVILDSEKHHVIIIGTPLPKYPDSGVILPNALAQTDFNQTGYAILAYTINKETKEACLRPLDRKLLSNPDFIRDFREMQGNESTIIRKELLEQALSDISGNYCGCDPRLFHILNFSQIKSDIEKLLN